ncbi:MAG: hypothetical protein EXS14_00660 [Planctomycetes bacterium]|nr:hypothetical protein [Planctomycetota bacterium]
MDGDAGEIARSIADALQEAKHVVLTTHITPDGDGFGAALALLRVLRSRGKRAEFINCSATPQNLRFLSHRGEFFVFDPLLHTANLEEADVIVATDLGGSKRLGRMFEPVAASHAQKVLIDHHRFHNDIFDLPLVVESASSSCEITHDLLRLMGVEIDFGVAEPLYVGVVNDTGSFAYDCTTPRVHRIAAELIERGVSPAKIWRELQCGQPLPKLHALGSALSSIQLECAGRLAFSVADKAVLKRLGVVPRDAFEIVNYLLRVRGVEVGVFFFPVDELRTKVSLRSAGKVDVCQLAERHGGGGHRFAAGCTVEGMDCAGAVSAVLNDMRLLLDLDVLPSEEL